MNPSTALQKAIYIELEKGIYPIYEVFPSSKGAMPFITFTDMNRETNFTKDNRDRFTYSVTLHGWSIGTSSIQSKEIEEFIYNTVMNLEMTGFDVDMVDLIFNTNLKEEESRDRVIFHSIQEFAITIAKRGD